MLLGKKNERIHLASSIIFLRIHVRDLFARILIFHVLCQYVSCAEVSASLIAQTLLKQLANHVESGGPTTSEFLH